jgi:uncharacterized RDD family membrane protein YckC
MNWYYVDAGQQAGPVDDAQFEELVRNGKIQPDTLVWREGMASWQAYHQTVSPGAGLAAAPAAVAVAAAGATADEAACAECNRIFAKADMVAYGRIYVCAGCKPIFMQKLAEGAKIETGTFTYAGFWVRLGAKFIDGLIMRIAGLPLGMLIGLTARSRDPREILMIQAVAGAAGFLIAMAYTVFFLGKFGATPGKMACKIKVVMADGAPITYGRAFGRFWAELLSGCPTLLIGYIMAGFDEQKRALHDRICNTRVIYK